VDYLTFFPKLYYHQKFPGPVFSSTKFHPPYGECLAARWYYLW